MMLCAQGLQEFTAIARIETLLSHESWKDSQERRTLHRTSSHASIANAIRLSARGAVWGEAPCDKAFVKNVKSSQESHIFFGLPE